MCVRWQREGENTLSDIARWQRWEGPGFVPLATRSQGHCVSNIVIIRIKLGTICAAVFNPGIVSFLEIRSTIKPLNGPVKSKSAIYCPVCRLRRRLPASDCGRAVWPFGILRIGRDRICAVGQALDVKTPLDRGHHNWIGLLKELVGRASICDV